MPLSAKVLSKVINTLRSYTSCDVADALSRLKHPGGGFIPGIVLLSPKFQCGSTKIIGPAHTVKFELNAEKGVKPEVEGHWIDRTVAGSVLVLAAPKGISNAIYGGIMTARAAKLGSVGTVISGRLRDLAQQRAMGWPVFAREVGTTAGSERCFASTTGEAINIETTIDGVEHSLQVHSGDLIVGDIDGVVCIPAELAEKVAEMVLQLAEVDASCLQDVEGGASVTNTFGERRGRLNC